MPRARLAVCMLLLAVPFAGGCQNRKVKVEIAAAGESTGRVFITNQTDKASLDAAGSLYGTKGERDEEL